MEEIEEIKGFVAIMMVMRMMVDVKKMMTMVRIMEAAESKAKKLIRSQDKDKFYNRRMQVILPA